MPFVVLVACNLRHDIRRLGEVGCRVCKTREAIAKTAKFIKLRILLELLHLLQVPILMPLIPVLRFLHFNARERDIVELPSSRYEYLIRQPRFLIEGLWLRRQCVVHRDPKHST